MVKPVTVSPDPIPQMNNSTTIANAGSDWSNDPASSIGTRARWYALYVRSRYEKKVYAQLLKKNVESYLPLVEEVRQWSDRKKKTREPLFKGYLFVKIALKEKLMVVQTDGVVKIVGSANTPSAIPDEQINWIRTVLEHPTLARNVRKEEYPVVGVKVEIVAGPLRGLRGVVSQVRGNNRLIIEVQTIARAFSVEVPPGLLEEAR